MKRVVILLIVISILVGISSCKKEIKKPKMPDGLYAKITTLKGDILLTLTYKKTPITVSNFVGLAEGKIQNSMKKPGEPYYNGLKFHRVIANFMIQGGCPQGTGSSGPGYSFDDEFHPDLRHDDAGVLSMANAGPATNGSQFFITHKPTPHLNDKHTVFGKVFKGQDVVNSIVKDDLIQSIEIIRVGKEAEAFQVNNDAFQKILAKQKEERQKKFNEIIAKDAKTVDEKWPNAIKTESGLRYIVMKEGKGATPKVGDDVSAHWAVWLLDGTKIGSSFGTNQPINFKVGMGHVVKAWDEIILQMKKGEKRTLIVPHHMGYGPNGRGPIPPYATLHFEMELLDFKSASPKK